jgi:hypothetical protein
MSNLPDLLKQLRLVIHDCKKLKRIVCVCHVDADRVILAGDHVPTEEIEMSAFFVDVEQKEIDCLCRGKRNGDFRGASKGKCRR